MAVVSHSAITWSVAGTLAVWIRNQFGVASEAYAKSSSADVKFGTSVVTRTGTCPTMNCPSVGARICGLAPCAHAGETTPSMAAMMRSTVQTRNEAPDAVMGSVILPVQLSCRTWESNTKHKH